MECDLTHNDSRVYLWLLKKGMANPSDIAEGTGIKRPRVYDSLKRLMERGFVVQNLEQKRPLYGAINAQIIVNELRAQIDSKKEAIESIEKQIIDQPPIATTKGIFFYNSNESFNLKLQEIIQSAEKKIIIMAVLDSSFEYVPLFSADLLGSKSTQGKEITLLFNVNAKNWEYCLDLYTKKARVYHYPQLKHIPTVIHIIDDEFLSFAYTIQHKGRIEVEYGILFSRADAFIKAFNFLLSGFIKQALSLQDRMEELKKSIIYPTEKLKSLFGISK